MQIFAGFRHYSKVVVSVVVFLPAGSGFSRYGPLRLPGLLLVKLDERIVSFSFTVYFSVSTHSFLRFLSALAAGLGGKSTISSSFTLSFPLSQRVGWFFFRKPSIVGRFSRGNPNFHRGRADQEPSGRITRTHTRTVAQELHTQNTTWRLSSCLPKVGTFSFLDADSHAISWANPGQIGKPGHKDTVSDTQTRTRKRGGRRPRAHKRTHTQSHRRHGSSPQRGGGRRRRRSLSLYPGSFAGVPARGTTIGHDTV